MASYNNTGVTSGSAGGAVNPSSIGQTINQAPTNTAGSATDSSFPSAGYGSNVDQNFGETGEKKSTMSKIKEKLLPKGPGPTTTEDTSTRDAAAHAHHASHAGNYLRSAQANADLNRE
ncbi:uncharacterized protein PAC_16119 [Phialocephala subalpina]|uniref:Uncharacterized protein n=1 Tax=Phialocephala subalpina TaxID=576137 RepID=A0A1L7XMH2_9HELO|nr:uncharacterized protein PAC_16119 [Phialocephala subalpina]